MWRSAKILVEIQQYGRQVCKNRADYRCEDKKSPSPFGEEGQAYLSQKRRPEHPAQNLPNPGWCPHPVRISTSVQPCEHERQTRGNRATPGH
jgi:hypothetical protein